MNLLRLLGMPNEERDSASSIRIHGIATGFSITCVIEGAIDGNLFVTAMGAVALICLHIYAESTYR
jgi:hypothetical protein